MCLCVIKREPRSNSKARPSSQKGCTEGQCRISDPGRSHFTQNVPGLSAPLSCSTLNRLKPLDIS